MIKADFWSVLDTSVTIEVYDQLNKEPVSGGQA